MSQHTSHTTLSSDDLATAFQQHEAGDSWEQVARDYGVARSWLCKQLEAAGYSMDNKHSPHQKSAGSQIKPLPGFNRLSQEFLMRRL